MTQDEIIEMAKQAGFFINDELTITSPFIEDICISPMLKEFAKLVAAKEHEAIIDLVAMYGGPVDLEAAIRVRGEA
jgi:selenophosphate synthase